MKNSRLELLWDTRQTLDFQYSEYINFTIFSHGGKKNYSIYATIIYIYWNTVRSSVVCVCK